LYNNGKIIVVVSVLARAALGFAVLFQLYFIAAHKWSNYSSGYMKKFIRHAGSRQSLQ